MVKKIFQNFFKNKNKVKEEKYKAKILPKIKEFKEILKSNKSISFLHYGHLGDIVNSLPVIKEISKDKKCILYIQKEKPIPVINSSPEPSKFAQLVEVDSVSNSVNVYLVC